MKRVTPSLAVASWLIAVVAVAVSLVVAPDSLLGGPESALGLVFLVFITVGALVTYRTAGNTVGWLLVAIGSTMALAVTTQALASRGGSSGWGQVAAWIGGLTWAPMIALLLALLAVFPTGRVVAGWWRLHWWYAAGFVLGAAVLNGFGPDFPEEGMTNPFANPAIDRFAGLAGAVVAVCMITGLAFGAASLLVRYRRGSSVERQQVKWFIFAAMLLIPAIALADANQETVGPVIFGFAAMSFPIAIGIAILKYRLYEIDRIINRTAVYAIVVGLLGLVFVAGAVWIPSRLPFEDNNLAVAASTLAVFFLFNPMRKRTQRFVDRRFYRSRYDAQQVADDFSARLRDQVDPEVVTSEWVGVVQRTMQPESVAVWVREGSS